LDTLETNGKVPTSNRGSAGETRAALFIVFAADAPELVGSFLPLGRRGEAMVFGRGPREHAKDDKLPLPRVVPIRQRPEKNEVVAGAVADARLSRDQLRITPSASPSAGFTITIANIGKRELLDSAGRVCNEVTLRPGEIAEIRGRMLLLAGERPDELPAARSLPSVGKGGHPFGEGDADGFVGESPAAWKLRDVMAFVGGRTAHVLLLGESGTGKEIVANAIHRLSARKGRKLVARNAATLPAGLIDAELFGHVANYPNVGMPERPGLIAEADGSTLFLDEIGELSHELSTRLLRVLDEKGEYQRLGDSRMRTSSFRLLGATNRALASLKEDVAARFRLRISVPTLRERREDIPLLARHLLRRAATQDAVIGERFLHNWDGKTGEPRISIELMKKLVTYAYRTNIRELDVLLWASLGSSSGDTADLTPEVEDAMMAVAPVKNSVPPPLGAKIAVPGVDVRTLTIDDVKNALDRAGGVHEKAWRDLGLANRHVLKRLVKKFGLGGASSDASSDESEASD